MLNFSTSASPIENAYAMQTPFFYPIPNTDRIMGTSKTIKDDDTPETMAFAEKERSFKKCNERTNVAILCISIIGMVGACLFAFYLGKDPGIIFGGAFLGVVVSLIGVKGFCGRKIKSLEKQLMAERTARIDRMYALITDLYQSSLRDLLQLASRLDQKDPKSVEEIEKFRCSHINVRLSDGSQVTSEEYTYGDLASWAKNSKDPHPGDPPQILACRKAAMAFFNGEPLPSSI